MRATLVLAAGLMLGTGWSAAQTPPQKAGEPATTEREFTLVCEAVYLPARSTWRRTVQLGFDPQGPLRRLSIDGVAVYSFALAGDSILTAVDNERIEIDTATRTWRSDFRGLSTSQGRCERG